MSVIKGLEWTFDTAASAYEKFRPGYVDELYKMIFDYITLNESSNAIEVGIGSGQATLPFLKIEGKAKTPAFPLFTFLYNTRYTQYKETAPSYLT